MKRKGTSRAVWMALLLLPGAPMGAQQSGAASAPPANRIRTIEVGSDAASFHVVSTIVAGPTESVLWDAQYLAAGGKRVADALAATGTRLTAIVISHGDHDHYMGLMQVLERFPGTPVYMSRSGLDDFIKRSPQDLAAEVARRGPGEVPDSIPTPRVLPAGGLRIDGHRVEFVEGLTGDVRAPASTAMWIPELRTVLAGDLVFAGVHPWLGDADRASRQAWRASLRRLQALEPEVVVPGHKKEPSAPDSPERIDLMLRYLDDYDAAMAAADSPEEVVQTMVGKYRDLALPALMAFGARKWFQR